jgi:hypothetical protein
VSDQATVSVRQLESLEVQKKLLINCVPKLQRHANQSLQSIPKARQERIRKKQIRSQNSAPVEGHINLSGGLSMGRGDAGCQWDQGGGARRAEKHGEG